MTIFKLILKLIEAVIIALEQTFVLLALLLIILIAIGYYFYKRK